MRKFYKALSLFDFITNPMKDIEIFGMFGQGNLGDEAMLVAALKCLPSKRCTPWLSYPNRPALNAVIRRRVRKHLLIGGGTLIHGGNTGWLDYVEMRSQQDTHVSFFGTGMAFTQDQIVNSSPAYQRWRSVLGRSQEIHLRGPHSVALCQRMGFHADVFGDFAFLLHSTDIPVRNHGERNETIGLNIGNCLGNQGLFEDAVVAIVKRLSGEHRLVFHVVVSADMEATHHVINRAGLSEGSYEIEEHYFDPLAFMHAIRSYRAFIGLKLHAAGLAMVAGVPTLMIAYLPKCLDFMAPLSTRDHMLLKLPLDIEVAFSKIHEVLARPADFVVDGEIAAIAARQRRTLEQVYLRVRHHHP